jgi:hypothetical protein
MKRGTHCTLSAVGFAVNLIGGSQGFDGGSFKGIFSGPMQEKALPSLFARKRPNVEASHLRAKSPTYRLMLISSARTSSLVVITLELA